MIFRLQEIDKELFADNPWTYKFEELLKIRDYIMVKTQQLQGIVLILFSKREHLLHVRQVESEVERTGIASVWVCSFYLAVYLDLDLPIEYFYFRVTKEQFVLDSLYMALPCALLTLTWLLMTICWKRG